MEKQKTKKILLVVFAVIFAIACYIIGYNINKEKIADVLKKPPESFAIIHIKGVIQGRSDGIARMGYDHDAIKEYIDELIEDESNKGIFLDVDSGGGTVYHSDEMYNKLLEYKEKTGRPVHAYFNTMAASGAYYISCAADFISANKNCWTGSIGVIISLTNLSELYDKVGIDEILITSGSNKGMGSPGSPMSEEHLAIYQSLVDESYDEFVNVVSTGRGLDPSRVREIADGRIYSAKQAKEIALVDDIQSYEEAIESMEELTGVEGYDKPLYTPTFIEQLFAKIEDVKPKSEMEIAVNMVNSQLAGVPLYMYTK